MLDLPRWDIASCLGVKGYIDAPEVSALKACVASLQDVVNRQEIALQELESRVAKQQQEGLSERRSSDHQLGGFELSDDIWENVLLHTAKCRDFIAMSGTCRGARTASKSPKMRQRRVEAGLVVYADQLLHKAQVACVRMSDEREAFWMSMQDYQGFVWGVLSVCEDTSYFQRHSKAFEHLMALIKR